MPRPSPQRIEALLRDLGPQLRRGELPREPSRLLPTGLGEIDALLRGGFPRGRLSELSGPPSSGRTSVALALLTRTTAAAEFCAVVDAADTFDPAAAEAAGAALDRVLWARPPDPRAGLRANLSLLETRGFALVLWTLPDGGPTPSGSTWRRLAAAAGAGASALVALSAQRSAGSAAEVALEMHAGRARFSETPTLLESLETEVRLVRHRSAPPGQTRLVLCA